MRKLLGLLLACLVSFSAAAQTGPNDRSQADRDLVYFAQRMDLNRVQTALNQGANPRSLEQGGYLLDIVIDNAFYEKHRKHKDQTMQLLRLLIENGIDITAPGLPDSALDHVLSEVASYAESEDNEGYQYAFDILDLMLSLTDSSRALSKVAPFTIEIVVIKAGFNHPELFRYLIDKGLRVQSRYVKEARKRVEERKREGDMGTYQEVADLLQQAYEEQSPEFIKEVVKRDLQIRKQCPALKKQF